MKVVLSSVRPGAALSTALGKTSAEYLVRCGRMFPADMKVFKSEAVLLANFADEQKRGAAQLWIADPGGLALSSEALATRIGQARDNGLRSLMLGVGPANGWSEAGRAASSLRLSLGPMTLPHELAALVLAEQIYRASTILQGHPYHLGH